jgi:hypothetical protein
MPELDPTEITEAMRTFHAADVAEQSAWRLHRSDVADDLRSLLQPA